MKVLLTGATGFLGANLVRVLLARGDEVHCIIRKPNICLEGLDVYTHTIPLVDHPAEVERLKKVMEGCSIVYHLAGIFDPSPGGLDRMVNLHVYGTRALLRAAEKAKVERFLFCSSSITVAFGGKDRPGTEEQGFDAIAAYGSSGPLCTYYRSKLQGEELVRGWQSLDTVIVNPDYIIGPYDVKPTSGQLILSMTKRWLPVYPRGGKCFLGAKECAEGHVAAALHGRSGERYLLGGHNLSYREFMEKVASVVGCRPPKLPLPRMALAVAGNIGEILSSLDPHRFAGLEPNVLRAMQEERYRSPQKMISELGITPAPIEDAIQEAYTWFGQHGYCSPAKQKI
jgi:dihydroflavonol-4-reductase